MKLLFYTLFIFFFISCQTNNADTKIISTKDFTQISDINEVKKIALNLDSTPSKFECYFFLYRLKEANNLKKIERLKSFTIQQLLKVVDTVYAFNQNDNNFEKVKLFDSLNLTNDTTLFDALKEEFYYGSGVELEELNKKEDNYYDKNDERNINKDFYAFDNISHNGNGSLDFYYFKIADSLKYFNYNQNDHSIFEKKINNILGYREQDIARIRTNFLKSVIKQSNNNYKITLIVEHESGRETKFEEDGLLCYQTDNSGKIISNTIQFYGNEKKEWFKL